MCRVRAVGAFVPTDGRDAAVELGIASYAPNLLLEPYCSTDGANASSTLPGRPFWNPV